MISQKCPRCSSKRIRQGYKTTSLFSKLICRYNLLCDNCNWTFAGFALPGTVGMKPKRPKVSDKKVTQDKKEEHKKSVGKEFGSKAASS